MVGLKLRFEAHGAYAELESGPVTLALYRRELMDQVAGGLREGGERDAALMAFRVEDVDDAFERLRERGAQVVTEPHDQTTWEIRVAHLRDPEGNLFEINQPLR